MRIAATGTVTPPTEPKVTSMGLEGVKTFTIRESDAIDGDVRQYELWIDGKLTWTGLGDDRADALLEAIISATGQAEEPPDN